MPFWRRHRTNQLVLLAYVAMALAYFSPALIRGIVVAPGDAWLSTYPFVTYFASFIRGGFSLWMPYEFLGTSWLGINPGLLYPINFIYFFLPTAFAFNLSLILHFAFAAFFTYLYAKQLGIKTFPSLLAGIVFGFSGFMMAHKGHIGMMNAATWLPLLMYLYEKIRTTRSWRYAVWAGLIIGIQISAGFMQACVYTYLILGLFILFYLWQQEKGDRLRFIVLAVFPILLGSLIALPQLLAEKQLSDFAWRVGAGYTFFTGLSFHPFMLPSLVFPFLYGGGYGGPWAIPGFPTEMSGFIGILPFVVCCWLLIKEIRRNKHICFWGMVALIALLLVMGKYDPLYKLMYYMPVYNLFRIPPRNWMEFDLAIGILFAFGLDRLLYDTEESKKNLLQIAKGVLMIGLLELGIFFAGKLLLVHPLVFAKFVAVHRDVLLQTFRYGNWAFIVPVLFVVAYLLWLWVYSRWPGRRTALLVSLGALVFLESFSFGGFHGVIGPKYSEINKLMNNPIISFIGRNLGYNRMAYIISDDVSPQLSNVPAKMALLDGYDPLVSNDLHEMLGMDPFGGSDNWDGLLKNNLLLSTLGLRYVVLQDHGYPVTDQEISNITASKSWPQQVTIPLGQWSIFSARQDDQGFILQSPDGKTVSLIQQPISLKPGTYYELSLKAGARINPTDVLCFDLNGGPGSDFEQELFADTSNTGSSYRSYFKIINTGNAIPQRVETRVFTYSRFPISVQDIQITELKNYQPPFLGGLKTDNNEKTIPLYQDVFTYDGSHVYENMNCLPEAFPVQNLAVAENIDDVKKKFFLMDFNPASTALVSSVDIQSIGSTIFSPGQVAVKQYEPDQVLLDADFQGTGFVVLADQYYPGWKALVDGKQTRIYKVDGLLRGVVVPSGHHSITFEYRPTNIYLAFLISALAFLGCVLSLLLSYIQKRRQIN